MNLIISCRQFYVNIVKKVKVEKCMSYNIETIKDSRKAKSTVISLKDINIFFKNPKIAFIFTTLNKKNHNKSKKAY